MLIYSNFNFFLILKVPGMLHSIAGGVFPFPPAVTELVKRLPPPNAFEVKIEIILKLNIKNFKAILFF